MSKNCRWLNIVQGDSPNHCQKIIDILSKINLIKTNNLYLICCSKSCISKKSCVSTKLLFKKYLMHEKRLIVKHLGSSNIASSV